MSLGKIKTQNMPKHFRQHDPKIVTVTFDEYTGSQFKTSKMCSNFIILVACCFHTGQLNWKNKGKIACFFRLTKHKSKFKFSFSRRPSDRLEFPLNEPYKNKCGIWDTLLNKDNYEKFIDGRLDKPGNPDRENMERKTCSSELHLTRAGQVEDELASLAKNTDHHQCYQNQGPIAIYPAV